MTGREVDELARTITQGRGFGEAFAHGIGLEVYEPPWISSARGTRMLQDGMVFSIEPGFTFPGGEAYVLRIWSYYGTDSRTC